MLDVFDDALDADEYDVVRKLGGMAMSVAKKLNDDKLIKRVGEQGQRYKALAEAYSSVRAAEETLKTSPDNAEANLVVGRYCCLMKGQWQDGLDNLAKGSDAECKALADKELARPAAPDAQVAVADGWYDLAQTQGVATRQILLAHASEWYERALPKLDGLAACPGREAYRETGR